MTMGEDDQDLGEDLDDQLLVVAATTAQELLQKLGVLVPFGALITEAGEIETFFPEDNEIAPTLGEQVDWAIATLRRQLPKKPFATAVVSVLALAGSERHSAIGVQLESAENAVSVVFPYRKGWFGWKFGDGEVAPGIFADPVYRQNEMQDNA